jgi:outer membrane biogenesis lipoprotein LolB
MKMPIVTALLAAALLSACGLAETGATAVAEADAAAEQARQGKALEEKVQRDIEAAQKTEADAIKRADEAAQ